jgi:hypothetical protein
MLMARLEEYANKFKHIQLERRGGILQMRLLGYGLALEGLAVQESWAGSRTK